MVGLNSESFIRSFRSSEDLELSTIGVSFTGSRSLNWTFELCKEECVTNVLHLHKPSASKFGRELRVNNCDEVNKYNKIKHLVVR